VGHNTRREYKKSDSDHKLAICVCGHKRNYHKDWINNAKCRVCECKQFVTNGAVMQPEDVETLLTPTQACSVCGKATPFFGVCRRCKKVLARCAEHGGAITGLNDESQQHRTVCKP
jgi:hypothetical protein